MKTRLWQTTQWGIAMLALSAFLNYVDRGALSVAMPQMQKELRLDAENLGRLASAFFWTYALLQIPAGWLVDRLDVKRMLACGFALWSLATGLTAYAGSFAALLALRLLLGAGESIAYPAYSRVIATRFAPTGQGLPNALIDAASKLGPGLSTLLGGLAVARFGWRAFFLVMGAGGLLWLIPWGMWRSHAHDAESHPIPQVSFERILRRRESLGTCLGLFALNYAWYFLIFWFPPYLVLERGFSQQQMAIVGSLPFWLLAASSLLTGWWSDRLISQGCSPTWVRKGFMCGGLMGVAGCLLFAGMPDTRVAVGVVMLAGLCMGFASSNNWAVTQTLAGRSAAGRWTGIQNGFGNLGGVVSPWLTGFVVKQTGSFYLAFAVTSVVLVAGAVTYFLLISRVEPICWEVPEQHAAGQGVPGTGGEKGSWAGPGTRH